MITFKMLWWLKRFFNSEPELEPECVQSSISELGL